MSEMSVRKPYWTSRSHFDNSLSDGAALFYTTPLPNTLQVLRQYALHMLFAPPALSIGMQSTDAPIRNPFMFQHKPNTLDRDRIVVPSGWDSWGKITVLREGFDPRAWGEAWERDMERAEGDPEESGAKVIYTSLVPDQGAKVCCPLISQCFGNMFTFIFTQASAASAIQQSHARAGILGEKLRREFQKIRSRSSWRIQKSKRRSLNRYCWTYGEQQL